MGSLINLHKTLTLFKGLLQKLLRCGPKKRQKMKVKRKSHGGRGRCGWLAAFCQFLWVTITSYITTHNKIAEKGRKLI
jgi:hypothetical protein